MSKHDYNYTAGVLVGLIGFFPCYFFFLLISSFPLSLPSSLACPATCTEGN